MFAQDATDPSVLRAAKAPKAVAVSECTAKSFSLTLLLSPPEKVQGSGVELRRLASRVLSPWRPYMLPTLGRSSCKDPTKPP